MKEQALQIIFPFAVKMRSDAAQVTISYCFDSHPRIDSAFQKVIFRRRLLEALSWGDSLSRRSLVRRRKWYKMYLAAEPPSLGTKYERNEKGLKTCKELG